MTKLSDPSHIQRVLARHGFHFSKALGQNFLINGSVCPRMAASCKADKETGVLEIGPGIGVLTWELSQVSKKVIAIELDSRLFPVLEETLSDCSNVKILPGDILKLDLRKLLESEFPGEEICVCANLPYYITTPVIMSLLESGLPFRAVTVMVQKEAARRICAPPGSRECGALSASVWYHCEPKFLFEVGRGSFLPPPNVDSAVIRLDLRKEPPVKVTDEKFFFSLSRAAFAQRRKTAANSISSSLPFSKSQIEEALTASGLEKNIRAEKLSLSQLAALANYLSNT